MRQVFDDPQPFIQAIIHESRLYKYIGWNLDWEPTDDVTQEDGLRYAAFIETFSTALHKENLLLTVDVATWSPIWNYTAISLTTVDAAVSMGTYTATRTTFSDQLNKLITAFGPERSGVGLEDDVEITLDELTWRLDQITATGALEIDIWKMPLPPSWWNAIGLGKQVDNGEQHKKRQTKLRVLGGSAA